MDECRRFVEIPASFISFCYGFEERALLVVRVCSVSKCDPYKYKCVWLVFFGQASLKLIIVQYAAVQFMAIATEHDV